MPATVPLGIDGIGEPSGTIVHGMARPVAGQGAETPLCDRIPHRHEIIGVQRTGPTVRTRWSGLTAGRGNALPAVVAIFR